MSIAFKAEQEAVRRYTRLAEAMRSHGNQEAAALFERMVREEEEHERLIEEWAALEQVQLRDDIGPVVWEAPQVPTDYDREAVDPVYSSPYRALAFAVHNEERAFHFYTQVAATARDRAVRDYAETLAREELGHAALLRAMRRRAWRLERGRAEPEPDIEPATIRTLPDLLAVVIGAERCLADSLDALVGDHPGLEPVRELTHHILESAENRLRKLSEPGDDALRAVESIEEYKRKVAALDDDPQRLLQRLLSDSDRCFAFYDAVVSYAPDEDIMLEAQKLSESVLERIGLLRDIAAQTGTA